jgi:hypothetical protein
MSRRTQGPSKATDSNLQTLAAAAATVEETGTRTRSGRVSKPPAKYEPIEKVEDDYDADDYDSHESEIASNFEDDADEEDEEDEDDADEDGNLDGFVVADKSESGGSDSEDDGKPAVPVKKRTPVKKRPVAAPRKRNA